MGAYPAVDTSYDDDELDPTKWGGFAPVSAPAYVPPGAPAVASPATGPISADPATDAGPYASVAAPPAMGSTSDLENRAGRSKAYAPVEPRSDTPAPAAPSWKDYAPAEKHGWGKFGSIMASLNPVSNEIVNNRPLENAERNYKNATGEFDTKQTGALKQQQEAREEQAQQSTEHLQSAQADAAERMKVGLTPDAATLHDLMAGDKGQPRVNPETGKPYQYLEALTAVNQSKADTKTTPPETDKTVRIVNGVPHEILIDKRTGADVKDLGQTKLPGESAGEKRDAAQSAQVEREARGSIRKAEGKFRDTQKSVGQLSSAIDQSKDGNGLLTSFVPTMEVLGINAANGVHRISPAEAEAAKLPGGWAEQFNSWFDKASTGKTSPQLVQEGKALAHILTKSAYDNYKATYDDESGIVHGYGGTDFEKRVPRIAEPTEPGAGGGLSVQAGGKTYTFKDQASADAFKKKAGL
jgi:hypothetical protein